MKGGKRSIKLVVVHAKSGVVNGDESITFFPYACVMYGRGTFGLAYSWKWICTTLISLLRSPTYVYTSHHRL